MFGFLVGEILYQKKRITAVKLGYDDRCTTINVIKFIEEKKRNGKKTKKNVKYILYLYSPYIRWRGVWAKIDSRETFNELKSIILLKIKIKVQKIIEENKTNFSLNTFKIMYFKYDLRI